MDITEFALKNNRTTLVGVTCLALAGFIAFGGLPRSEDPGFIVRTARVTTFFPGASPERMELLVSDKLEEAIRQMPELEQVRSTSREGLSVINVDIKESYKKMRPIWDSLRRKVDEARPDLPDGVVGPFVDDEFGDVFGIIIGLTGEGYSPAELEDVADRVKLGILALPMVGKCEINGIQEERIYIEFNNAKLAESGLTPFELSSLLSSRNIITPGGTVDAGPDRISLEPSGNFESVDELKKTVISLPTGNVVFLGDLVDISRGYIDPQEREVRINGTSGLAIAVSLREGGDITQLGAAVTQVLHDLKSVLPIGLEFEMIAYQPAIVEKKIDEFVSSLLQSIGIVMAVMLVTLGLRTGLVVSSLIPVTMLASMLLMQMFGIGLDQISLASLIIALGMLVDNAIVMSEAILVEMEKGTKPFDAAMNSARELKVSLLSASLTTSAAFLPIFLAKSAVGEYTASIFKVVTIALLSSWVLSLTFIPLLCVVFLRPAVKTDVRPGRSTQIYRALLGLLLRNRWVSVVSTAAMFMGVLQLFPLLPFAFFPPADRPLIRAELELPEGSRFERTLEVVKQFESFLADFRSAEPGDSERPVSNYASFVGSGAPRYNLGYGPESPSSRYAYSMVNLHRFDDVKAFQKRINQHLLSKYPDLMPKVTLLNYGPPVDNPVEIRLSGTDIGELRRLAEEVKARLRTLSGTRNIDDDWGHASKKLEVKVNGPRARRAGVTHQEIAASLQTVLSGLETTEFREGDALIPVVIRSSEADRKDLGKIETLSVYSQASGGSVLLKQVADVSMTWQPAKISRRDQVRTLSVTSGLDPGVSSRDILTQIQPWLDQEQARWSSGYGYELGGEEEESAEANASIMAQLPIAGFIILVLLVGQFNSLRRAGIILLTIPLGVIGVILGLLAMRSYFGFMTLLGIVSLAGIVINNAIVLLDRINLELDSGKTQHRAILDAAQARFRPILLTTTTTVGGLIPLLLGGGAMFEPMAIAIMFGLVFSTFLTLGLVPVLYALAFGVRFEPGDLGHPKEA